MRRLCNFAIMLLVFGGLGGCTFLVDIPKAAYAPTEIIQADNIARLGPTLCWQVKSISMWDYEPTPFIRAAAVDANRGRVFAATKRWKGNQPPGIYGYDLRTGQRVGRTHIPARPDLTGKGNYGGDGPIFFDYGKQRLWYDITFAEGTRAMLESNLNGDRPKITAHDVQMPDCPDLGDGRLLLHAHNLGTNNNWVAFLDTATGRVSAPIELPVVENAEWTLIGGTKERILCALDHKNQERSLVATDLCSLEIRDGKAKMVASVGHPLRKGEGGLQHYIDPARKYWLVFAPGWLENGEKSEPLQIYDASSMKLVREIHLDPDCVAPASVDMPPSILVRFATSPLAPLLAIAANRETRPVFLYDLDTGVRLAQFNIGTKVRDLAEAWTPVFDSTGRYLCLCGSHNVWLYAVRPDTAPLPTSVSPATMPRASGTWPVTYLPPG